MIKHISKYTFPVIVGRSGSSDGVYDADTFYGTINLGFDLSFKDQTFRLYGINAYEIRRNSSKGIGDEHVAKGKIAAAAVSELMPDGIEVLIETVKDKEKFGRYLAIVYVPINEGINTEGLKLLAVDSDQATHFCLNDWLVREGHAWVQEY